VPAWLIVSPAQTFRKSGVGETGFSVLGCMAAKVAVRAGGPANDLAWAKNVEASGGRHPVAEIRFRRETDVAKHQVRRVPALGDRRQPARAGGSERPRRPPPVDQEQPAPPCATRPSRAGPLRSRALIHSHSHPDPPRGAPPRPSLPRRTARSPSSTRNSPGPPPKPALLDAATAWWEVAVRPALAAHPSRPRSGHRPPDAPTRRRRHPTPVRRPAPPPSAGPATGSSPSTPRVADFAPARPRPCR